MTIRIHISGPKTTSQFEKTQVGGTITKVVGPTRVDACDEVPSLSDRIGVAGGFRVVRQLPDVSVLRVQPHGEELAANQRWRDVESVDVGADQAWVDQTRVDWNREPEATGAPSILLLTDPFAVL